MVSVERKIEFETAFEKLKKEFKIEDYSLVASMEGDIFIAGGGNLPRIMTFIYSNLYFISKEYGREFEDLINDLVMVHGFNKFSKLAEIGENDLN
jgi:hypothetical protein